MICIKSFRRKTSKKETVGTENVGVIWIIKKLDGMLGTGFMWLIAEIRGVLL
jgi:hypothetical protein